MCSDLDFPRMGDVVRLPSAPVLALRPTAGSICAVSRTATNEFNHGRTAPYALRDGYLVGVHLRRFHSYDLWLKGQQMQAIPVDPGALWFHHMELNAEINFCEPFDIVWTYVPQTALAELPSADGRKGTIGHLRCPPMGARDAVIEHLNCCLVDVIDQAKPGGNTLFADSVLLALLIHLATTYGNGLSSPRRARPSLASWQENRAKEFIDANIADKCSLAEIANQCNLSPGHFLRAFKATVGLPPHRWLALRRIEKAKNMMLSDADKSMAEIAAELGFGNQSHFARAFSQANGCTPTDWKRSFQSGAKEPEVAAQIRTTGQAC